jgi:hypothetical protein
LGDSGDTFTIPSGATFTNSGTATGFGGGKILQVQSATSTVPFFDTTNSAFVDLTGITVNITPSSTSSTIWVTGKISGNPSLSNYGGIKIVRDSTDIGIATGTLSSRTALHGSWWVGTTYASTEIPLSWIDSPSTLSQITYKVQGYAGGSDGVYMNQTNADADNGDTGRHVSSIIVLEIDGS